MPEKLTPQEEQAMYTIWKTGEGSVKSFLENMESDQAIPYTTLASTIKNLEKKGYLTSRQVGNTNWYMATIDEKAFKKESLKTLVKQHFDNSYKDLVAFFAEQKKISAKELQEVIDLIERKKTK
jgi:BlaI family penicillinase repressor